MLDITRDFKFGNITPAGNLEEAWAVFDPTLAADPRSEFYIPRSDPQLQKLLFELQNDPGRRHAFLCGHRGSGKTTELARLCLDPKIRKAYDPVYLNAKNFISETVHLTHDALMVEIALKIIQTGKPLGLDPSYEKEIDDWGKQIVETFLHDEKANIEAGAKAGAWLAFFKAGLSSRREWKREEKQILEPRVHDLIDIINRMAQELKNKTGKRLLVVVDDLEKGESDAHRAMHTRLFQENYSTLVQPRLSIIYIAPVYFRALPGSRIPNDELYAFSAVRLYEKERKKVDNPPLSKDHAGYELMREFVERRVKNCHDMFEDQVLDDLLRIGGGLFRETARAIRDAAYMAISRGGARIEPRDAEQVFNQVKKEYQPIIRGEAVEILTQVLNSAQGWVEGVEPFLQSRAVVEYENGDLWLDVRHVLKPYIRTLADDHG